MLVAKPAHAETTFTVTNTADPGDGICSPGGCTLGEAITAANNTPGADTGANQLQNKPFITSASTSSDGITIL